MFSDNENKFEGSGKELLNDPEVRRSFRSLDGFYKCNISSFKLYSNTSINIWFSISFRSYFVTLIMEY